AAYVRLVGKRLRVALGLPSVHDAAQFVERGLCDAEIDRGVGPPEPVQIGAAERREGVRAIDDSFFRDPSRICKSLRVARRPITSQPGTTRRPSAVGGSMMIIAAEGFVILSGRAMTSTKSAASSIEANILRPVTR